MVARPRKEVEKPEGSKWPWIRKSANSVILKGAAHLPKRSRSPGIQSRIKANGAEASPGHAMEKLQAFTGPKQQETAALQP